MKAIMISIKPKWLEKISNGDKNNEIRKGSALYKAITKLIEQYGYATLFAYCTKEDSFSRLIDYPKNKYVCEKNFKCEDFPKLDSGYEGKGKVVAKFTCNKVEHFEYETCSRDISGYWLDNGEVFKNKGTCLTGDELWNYIKSGDGTALYIKDLVVFDKPIELSKFKVRRNDCPFPCSICNVRYCQLKKAPQSWCYIEL